MNGFCKPNESFAMNVEGDVGADPFWCAECGCNFDIEEMPISQELKLEWGQWASEYGKWIDWSLDQLIPNGIAMEEEHNKQGQQVTDRTKGELGGKYRITFSASTMGRRYACKNQS
ncbi:hypothetical protein HF072_05515 [Bacillus sp. RO3]|nr:hypothetical protein [Bacillus sp. RO3]